MYLAVTTTERAYTVAVKLTSRKLSDTADFLGFCLIDAPMGSVSDVTGFDVVADRDSIFNYVCRNWVDEILFDADDDELFDALVDMGVACYKPVEKHGVHKFGLYTVKKTSIVRQRGLGSAIKRFFDIIFGLVGSVLTCLIYLFVAPFIKIASPGPVFFKQERIGLNGKHFYMYKFRSMVLNADELKKQYIEKNRVKDGMMFKMDWDPRIIGNKELPNGKKKTGIGEFIRKTSIDEFPQFFNILKGEMSLIGTRPPTLDEWEKYENHHRVRMATKPGLTGMWQVSGRSDITDFEKVVALDKKYITDWSLLLDLKIIFKTIFVVFSRKGSL